MRNDLRGPTPDRFGKPGVSLPANDPRAVTIVEKGSEAQWTTTNTPPKKYFTPHDQFPNALLVSQAQAPGDNTDANTTYVYEVLPGAIKISTKLAQDTGVPILTSTQRVAANDLFDEGELVISGLVIASIALGSPTKVTFTTQHRLPSRCYVKFNSTNSTPALDGVQRIIAVPDPFSILIGVHITAAGTAGTMDAVNRIDRELVETDNVNVLVKVDSMIACADVTTFNEDIYPIWKDFSFADYLQGLTFLKNDSESVSGGATEYSLSLGSDGSLLPFFQNGYRGPCQGHRLRLFSSGPPASAYLSPYKPTFIAPASGSYSIHGQSTSIQVSTGGTANAISHSFKAGSIQPCITGGHSVPTDTIGTGPADCKVRLLPSSPARFFQGDIITLMEMPQKLGAALWQTIVWLLTVPYTSGLPPADFTYSTNPAVYPSGSAITTNSPVGLASPSAFSISPAIPGGMSFNASTGAITGTPSAATVPTLYKITCTDTTPKTAYFIMTIT